MSNRDKFKEWISGNYNIRHPFNDLLDLLILSDEMPSPYNLEDHTHTISDIVSLQIALDGKSDIGHSHVISDITNLQLALDGKAPTSHTHTISQVTNLQTELDGKIPKSPKAAARANVATGTSGLAVTVLGLSVISAAALTRLDEYGAAINDILSRLRSREIIAT